jgi:hypothetical protein
LFFLEVSLSLNSVLCFLVHKQGWSAGAVCPCAGADLMWKPSFQRLRQPLFLANSRSLDLI